MPDAQCPLAVATVVPTIAEIFRAQNQPDVAEVLEGAQARFEQTEYDNWNGGTYTWALRLEISVAAFGHGK